MGVCAFVLGVYILVQQHVVIPGRLSPYIYRIDSPGYIFIALACFAFAASILLYLWDENYKTICTVLFFSVFILFGIGFFMAEMSF